MTQQQVYRWFLLVGCCLPVSTWGQQPVLKLKETKYKTNYDYIINNFKGAVEYVQGGPSFRSGGIVVGYYLSQYHHQPLYAKKERKRIAAASKDASILEQPNTRPGEASLMVEVGMHVSGNSKWLLHGNFYVMNKFIDMPIGCRWTIPIQLVGYNMFSSTSVGCLVQYLHSSTYDMYETAQRNLKQQTGQELSPPIHLKTQLNDMPSFYYSLLVEWGLIFPLGIFASCRFYLPLDAFNLGSKLVYEPQEDKKLTSEYVQNQRSAQRKMVAWSVGMDFCRLLKYFNKPLGS